MESIDWIILGSILAYISITFIVAGICESKSDGGMILGAIWPLWPLLALCYGCLVLGEKIGEKLKKRKQYIEMRVMPRLLTGLGKRLIMVSLMA